MTKIRFSKGFVFATIQSANEFEDQRARFFGECELRDDYMEVHEGLDLDNIDFQEFLLTFKGSRGPWYLSSWIFWPLSLILLMSWPLRVFLNWQTARVHLRVTKLFGTDYLSPSNRHYTGQLVRTTTGDSVDWDVVVENANYLIVYEICKQLALFCAKIWIDSPSYSESLLLDRANHSIDNRSQSSLLAPMTKIRRRFANMNNEKEEEGEDSMSETLICNDNVIANYGAVEMNGRGALRDGRRNDMVRNRLIRSSMVDRRSRSLNLIARWLMESVERLHPENRRRNRSMSVSSIRRSTFRPLLNASEPESCGDILPNDSPPPYEVALRMCVPLYEKLRRSMTSLTSRFQISHSISMDLSQRSNKDGDNLL